MKLDAYSKILTITNNLEHYGQDEDGNTPLMICAQVSWLAGRYMPSLPPYHHHPNNPKKDSGRTQEAPTITQ